MVTFLEWISRPEYLSADDVVTTNVPYLTCAGTELELPSAVEERMGRWEAG